VHAKFGGKLSRNSGSEIAFAAPIREQLKHAQAAYLELDHAKAIQRVLEIADIGNKYFQDNKPWELFKTDPQKTHDLCTFVVNVCKAVTIGLKPVLPDLAAATETMLGIPPVDFQTPLFDLSDHQLGPAARLLERLERGPLDKIVEASTVAAAPPPPASAAPVKAEITFDQFEAVDLRAAKILTAERVPKSDKLLKLVVDVGEAQPRQVIAGIGLAYAPEQIVGKVVACVVNLKPAKIMGQESRAMLLACGPGGKELALTELPASTVAGTPVK
jgi:methionyl-tRNA synthetase